MKIFRKFIICTFQTKKRTEIYYSKIKGNGKRISTSQINSHKRLERSLRHIVRQNRNNIEIKTETEINLRKLADPVT